MTAQKNAIKNGYEDNKWRIPFAGGLTPGEKARAKGRCGRSPCGPTCSLIACCDIIALHTMSCTKPEDVICAVKLDGA